MTLVIMMVFVMFIFASVVFVPVFLDIDLFGRPVVVLAIFVIGRFVDYDRRTVGSVYARIILAVSGCVDIAIPDVVNKIDRPAAGLVLIAIPVPFFCMPRRHAEINRRIPGPYRADDNRFRIDQPRRRIIAYIKAAVKSRFAHTDRNAGMRLVRYGRKQGRNQYDC
jgi:hypothetical protein